MNQSIFRRHALFSFTATLKSQLRLSPNNREGKYYVCVSAALILRDDLFQMPVWKYAEELHREQLPVIEMPLDKYNMNEELFHAILRAFAERRSQNSHVLYWFPPQSERNLLLPALLL